MSVTIIRWLQLITAILGLSFASSSSNISGLVVFSFVIALIYEIILIISQLLDRPMFQSPSQIAIEVVILVFLMLVTIYNTSSTDKHVYTILAIVCGYLLGALFVISAYEITRGA